jgi:KRAB domain-containing zinc finger protein
MSKSKYQQQFDEGKSLNWDDLLGWEKEVQEEEKLKAASEYKCGKCGKEFKLKIGLNLHIRSQNCEKTQEKLHSVRDHDQNNSTGFTGDLKKTFECYKCEKTFKRKYNLSEHLATHELVKRFECRTCKKVFKHNSNLTRHLKSHKHEKWFECRICRKKFIFNSSLKTHKKLHSAEKNFKCDESAIKHIIYAKFEGS